MFLYFANSLVETSVNMIYYIATARISVYRSIGLGLWVNEYSTLWDVICCRWWVTCHSIYLTNRNLGHDDFVKKTAGGIADFP